MIPQPDFSSYRLRFTCIVPLDHRHVEPDEDAFERHNVELLRFDDDVGDDVPIATAIVYRVRPDSTSNLTEAADAEPDSELLEDVCVNALDEDGQLPPSIAAAFSDVVVVDVLVIDRIEFGQADNDAPVLRGLIARGVLQHLGRVGSMMFLPPEDARLWQRAVGARRAGRFVVASADLVLPEFPIGPLIAEG